MTNELSLTRTSFNILELDVVPSYPANT